MTYWMPNRSGYTMDIRNAGLYTALELDDCAGNGYDWFAERVIHFKNGHAGRSLYGDDEV